MNATRYQVYFRSDIVVTGIDPEMADMSNPRGERYGEAFYAVAEDALGYRREWASGFCRSYEEIEAAYQLLAPPVELWQETYAAYGSQAYVESDEEAAWAAREREIDSWEPQHVVGLPRR